MIGSPAPAANSCSPDLFYLGLVIASLGLRLPGLPRAANARMLKARIERWRGGKPVRAY